MSTPRSTLHIRCAQDMFEALDDPEDGVRLSVLQAISHYPEQAVGYGPWNGQDLIGRLIDQGRRDPSPLVRSVMVKVVAGFRSRRVLDFLKERMRATVDVDLVLELEPRFGVESLSDTREFLLDFIGEPAKWPAQSLVAARLLLADASLSKAQRLRVTLLSDGDATPPPLDAESEDAWVEELNGALSDRARTCLARQGDAILRLWKLWDRLSDGARGWLLDWTGRVHPDTARAAIPAILDGSLGADVASAALRCALALGVEAEAIGPARASGLLAHSDARVRAAALDAGLGEPREVAALIADGTQDSQVRQAALRQCMRVDARAAVTPALALLDDPDWRIRASAAEALVSLGDSVVERVRPVLLNGSAAARPAAARVLVALRGEEWLEQELATLAPR